jgi:hypothetical protein
VGWSDQLQGVVANDLGFVAQLRGGAGESHVVGAGRGCRIVTS